MPHHGCSPCDSKCPRSRYHASGRVGTGKRCPTPKACYSECCRCPVLSKRNVPRRRCAVNVECVIPRPLWSTL